MLVWTIFVSVVVAVFWIDVCFELIADKGFIIGPYLRYRARRRARARRVVTVLKGEQ